MSDISVHYPADIFLEKAELVNDSQIRSYFRAWLQKNILNQNNSISPEAEHLLLNNCNADTQRELSNLLPKRPQLRALSLAKQEVVFCSTHPGLPVGPVAEKERWRHDMLIRFPEDTGTLPWILLKHLTKTVRSLPPRIIILFRTSSLWFMRFLQYNSVWETRSCQPAEKMSLCSRTTAAYKRKSFKKYPFS
ncbi:signal protein [Escherichia coli]|nr:signal protein [Escherichia coli]